MLEKVLGCGKISQNSSQIQMRRHFVKRVVGVSRLVGDLVGDLVRDLVGDSVSH